MRFAVLGPLRISAPAGAVQLNALQERLLGMLLLAEERPVPVDVIAGELWGGTLTPAADERIASLVDGLRRALPGDGTAAFTRSGTSHRLAVRPGETDIGAVRRDVQDALVHVRFGEDEPAAALLDAALARWRGRPLSGLTGPYIDAEAARLLEFKAEIAEARFGAMLRLGRHDTLICEAREAVRDRPLDQDAVRRLMAALAAAGRDSDAKQAYEELEARLAARAERPAPELRDLLGRIASGEPPPPAPGPHPPGPHQLHPAVPDFTGRTAALRRLDRSRVRRASGVVVSGPAGIGKTALGLAWAHRRHADFPDGQLFADLRGTTRPADPLTVLHGFMRDLGFPAAAIPDDPAQAAADFRAYAAGRRLLVFLDDARDADQVLPLLPGTGGAFTIVTARNPMERVEARSDIDALELDGMDTAEAEALLLRRIGTAPSPAATASLAPLIARCGGLPLALSIAADLLGDPAPTGRHRAAGRTGLQTVLDESFQRLGAPQRRLYLTLAPLPGPGVPGHLALALARRAGDDPQRLLADLVDSRWLLHADDRYEAHALVADYAADLAARELPAADRDLVRDRVIAHYHRRDAPTADYEFLTAAYEAWWEHPNASRLASVLCAYAQRGHRSAELARLGERAAAATADLGPVERARHCNLVVVAAYAAGDSATAADYGRRTLALLERTPGGDRIGTARANLGGALARLGRHREALPVLEAAVAAARAGGAWDGVVTASLSLADAHKGLGDLAAAEAVLLAARAVDRDRSRGLRATLISTHLDDLRPHPAREEAAP